MNHTIPRSVPEQIAAATRDDTGELPDLFDNTVDLIAEIDLALGASRSAVARMACARMDRSLDEMRAAHLELEKLLGQSRLLSESLGRVLKFHVERRKAKS